MPVATEIPPCCGRQKGVLFPEAYFSPFIYLLGNAYESALLCLRHPDACRRPGHPHPFALRRTSVTLPNGIVTTYTPDDANRLENIEYKLGGTMFENYAYELDDPSEECTPLKKGAENV
jgi:hypothetical protein